ncbi:molybdopterin synthase sulfur carrier subunit [Serinibacter arcticus]|uniref:Molybdopterin synthase sulfur carrier subunit n=1 Tax=Serinibacter arcticus TaxID=1655435 RepID=A0A2U1ZWU9_9MICO|nr:MoaD/ThiS family protein [Serinibacter arcticus]PWD51392.1 molybdopterin synthase sulfur carrier subunit [Serinibacter arcticus]
MTAVTVRLFAGAAEAYGAEEATIEAATLADVVATLARDGGPGTADVLTRCSFLVAGVRTDDPATPVPAGSTLDVLPPFAGG